MVFRFFLPGTNARRPPRLAGGLRTWIPAASSRGSTPSARAQANTSGSVRRRRPGRSGTAHPRSARRRRVSPSARGDGGAVDTGQRARDRVRQIMAQMDQRGHRPVDGHQLVTGAGTRTPLPGPASCGMAAAFATGPPRRGLLPGQARQTMPRDSGGQPMRQDRRLTMTAATGSCHLPATTPHPLSRTDSLREKERDPVADGPGAGSEDLRSCSPSLVLSVSTARRGTDRGSRTTGPSAPWDQRGRFRLSHRRADHGGGRYRDREGMGRV